MVHAYLGSPCLQSILLFWLSLLSVKAFITNVLLHLQLSWLNLSITFFPSLEAFIVPFIQSFSHLCVSHSFPYSLTLWSIHTTIHSLTYTLIHSLFIHSLSHLHSLTFIHLVTPHPSFYSSIQPSMHSLHTHPSIPFTHFLTQLLFFHYVLSLSSIFSLIYQSIHSLMLSSIHSFTHSLTFHSIVQLYIHLLFTFLVH